MPAKLKGGRKYGARIRQIRRNIDGDKVVASGVPKGAGEYEDGISIAVIAAVQNWGTEDGRVPARPFFSNAIEESKPLIKKLVNRHINSIITGTESPDLCLELIGQMTVGEILKQIDSNMAPELAESTKKAKLKKGNDPVTLIDDAFLKGAISYVLRSKRA